MNLLKGKTAVITGASRGIGKAIATRFAKEGANLVISATNDKLLTEVKTELEAFGGDVERKTCDVSNYDSVADLIKLAVDTFGGIDILVNNAGIARDKLIMLPKISRHASCHSYRSGRQCIPHQVTRQAIVLHPIGW